MNEAAVKRVAELVTEAYSAKVQPPMPDRIRSAFLRWLTVGGELARAMRGSEITRDAINHDLDRYETWTRRRGPRLAYLDDASGTLTMK
jgi:hypothetical protein